MDARSLPTLGAHYRPEHGSAGHRVLTYRPHPEQGFRTCLGILRLYRGIEPARAETVSARALEIGAMNYRSVASILANNLDRVRQGHAEPTLFDHPNVRGPRYFN